MPDDPKAMFLACGLYRTTRAFDDAPTPIAAGALVNFHNHSEEGVPVVLTPAFNVFNRWQWTAKPIYVRDPSWLASLQRIPAEGFYALRADVAIDDKGARWKKGTLVQLGYDRTGTGIIFIAQLRHNLSENSLWFSEHGVRLSESQMELLEPLVVFEEPDPTTAGAEKKQGK